jgi:hypothetical protein
MSLARVLLGPREPMRARAGLVHGIASARLTFEVELGLRARAAAVVFEPPAIPGLDELLAGIADDTALRAGRCDDAFGLGWATLSGASLDDLAISIGVLAESFDRVGTWEQLVCAAFAFEARGSNAHVYWIYNFARACFYAFVPLDAHRRDSAQEQRLQKAAARDLRLEPDREKRYPLWGIPV